MQSWLVFLPPVILLTTAFFSRNLLLSAWIGIVSAALIGTNFSLVKAFDLLIIFIKNKVIDPDFKYMYGFLFILGIIIALITFTGGSCAFGNFVKKRLKNAKKTESASLLLSLVFWFDDYLNVLTMGCLMQPLSDKFKIPRTKIAFLINIMASPLLVLIPVSSWIALIVKELKEGGVNLGFSKYIHHQIQFPGGMFQIGHNVIVSADPFYTYLKAIPFIFYSLILILSAWYIVRKRISYGPMYEHEKIATETGNLYGGKEARFKKIKVQQFNKRTYVSDLLIPIISLIVSTLIAIPWTGHYYLFGGTNTLFTSFREANIMLALFWSSIISLIIALISALIKKTVRLENLFSLSFQGIYLMYSSVIILFSVLLFSSLLNKQLHTGNYLAQLILPYINLHWLPVIIFLLSTAIAFGTGSSWGTIGIMFPISIPMISSLSGLVHAAPLQDVYVLLPTIGAVISGALAGTQLSPISDPVTMTATSTGCYQLDHAKTQAWYLLPIIIGTSISFIFSGFLKVNGSTINGLICMLIGLGASIALLTLNHKIYALIKNKK